MPCIAQNETTVTNHMDPTIVAIVKHAELTNSKRWLCMWFTFVFTFVVLCYRCIKVCGFTFVTNSYVYTIVTSYQ